jgi:hypothetical protein
MNNILGIELTVTTERMAKGQRGSRCFCPIALAIRDRVLPETQVSVWRDLVIIGRSEYRLDAMGQYFIRLFDENGSYVNNEAKLTLHYHRPSTYFL